MHIKNPEKNLRALLYQKVSFKMEGHRARPH